MKIEFFHDVLCAWCYAFSPKVRKLSEEFPQLEIIHRCFALAPTADSIAEMFGSGEEGKKEILKHWQAANEIDDEHRICVEDMACKTFDFPFSMPGLLACKAAELQGGGNAHWALFDRIQKAHFTEALDISQFNILLKCARDVGLEIDKFISDYNSKKVNLLVENDIERAEELGVYVVPSIVLGEESILTGVQDYEDLRNFVKQAIN